MVALVASPEPCRRVAVLSRCRPLRFFASLRLCVTPLPFCHAFSSLRRPFSTGPYLDFRHFAVWQFCQTVRRCRKKSNRGDFLLNGADFRVLINGFWLREPAQRVAYVSHGRKPVDAGTRTQKAPAGGDTSEECVAPCGGLDSFCICTTGFRPWLTCIARYAGFHDHATTVNASGRRPKMSKVELDVTTQPPNP